MDLYFHLRHVQGITYKKCIQEMFVAIKSVGPSKLQLICIADFLEIMPILWATAFKIQCYHMMKVKLSWFKVTFPLGFNFILFPLLKHFTLLIFVLFCFAYVKVIHLPPLVFSLKFFFQPLLAECQYPLPHLNSQENVPWLTLFNHVGGESFSSFEVIVSSY